MYLYFMLEGEGGIFVYMYMYTGHNVWVTL